MEDESWRSGRRKRSGRIVYTLDGYNDYDELVRGGICIVGIVSMGIMKVSSKGIEQVEVASCRQMDRSDLWFRRGKKDGAGRVMDLVHALEAGER